MNKASPTPFTDTNGVTPFSVYMDSENAIAPLDDVIRVLLHAFADFNLGNRSLDEFERFELLNNYQTLGSTIMLVTDTLEKVVEDFEKIRPQKEEAQTQSNPESTT